MKSKFSLFVVLLITLLASSPLFAEVKVSTFVSDNKVVIADIFILTVEINSTDNKYQLDTRPLEEYFTVYRPSQSQSTKYINGDFSQQTQWKVRLQAKESGKIIIPALQVGDLTTDVIEINVIEASQVPESDSDQQRSVFIENSIDKEQVYIGQSVIFTTKLYISKNSNDLDLAAPNFEGAEITVFGQDNNKQTLRNGIRYNTITRQYKMTATQAGQFVIDSPLLTGSVLTSRRTQGPINVRGERLNIDVKAIPDDFQGDWLVSEDLRLLEDNDLTAQSYKAGEPITRSITLQIASIDKDKLPNIKLNYPKSLRVYPDQDQLTVGQANGLTYGVRTIRHAIIADTEGTLTLPEITLNWFNSRTNQQETATLAKQIITILPADKQQSTISPTVQPTTTQSPTTIIVDNSALIYWQLAVALLIIVIIFMILYHLSLRRLQNSNKKQATEQIKPLNHHYMALLSCFTKNSATLSYNALLNYAQQQYPTVKSLSELADKTALENQYKQQLKDEIQWLQICCSDQTQHWDANKLSALIKMHEAIKVVKPLLDPMNLNP